MRIVDCFTAAILTARKLARGENPDRTADEMRQEFKKLFNESESIAKEHGHSDDVIEAAKFAIIAYIDELLLCSNWPHRSQWQLQSLQRTYFNTTNAGSDFYQRLNELNKFGPDRELREVYALCLGLGFKGKYFRGEDRKKYEEIKSFNLALLLPDEAVNNIDDTVLFPSAYKASDVDEKGGFKSRINIYPYVVGGPILLITALAFIYHLYIGDVLDQIQSLIK